MQTKTTVPATTVTMSEDEWRKTHPDFKGLYNGQRCVLRMTERGTSLVPVQIIGKGK